ncbi:hypothetical protein KY284_011401 [Solanum tuberosum]|nr:hypothetical protein KY284_011401 [Solanum tuberosum]
MAYAAITSLMSTIQQSMELTGCNLQSSYEKLESLRAIMEKSCTITGDLEALTSLEAEIAEVAYSTEDMIDSESRKVSLAKTSVTRRIDFWELCFSLKQAVEHIGSTMNKWKEMQKKYNNIKDLKVQNMSLGDVSRLAVETENVMVGHENEFEMMQDQIARGSNELEVVSIVGMGGIGKTTLANKVYSDPFIMSRFDIRAKITVSQEYCARNVLLGLLSSVSGKADELYEKQDDGQLADRLQKLLKGRRYLIVIDDIWTTDSWDDVKLCFPDCDRGSRILLTTRNMEVAEYASSGKPPCQMPLMNFDESWSLLFEKVFVKDNFPPEFEQLGKQIALECKGLPLTIVVIAGLLSKVGKTLNEWTSVAKNVSSMASIDLDIQCMRVLSLSYHHLPRHLKSCFLYFAIFPEDKLIFVNELMELWTVEGFLKVETTKTIEEVAETCLKDLIDRSLIFIHHFTFDGKIKSCGMHDVTRELCLREARNMNFVNVIKRKNDRNPYAQFINFSSKSRGRISINDASTEEIVRCHNSEARSVFIFHRHLRPDLLCFKLVRVLDLASLTCLTFPSWILNLTHLRYLALSLYLQVWINPSSVDIPPSIASLHYLQTFILKLSNPKASQNDHFILPSEILTMPLLSHLLLDWNYLCYLEPTEKSLVLKNLQCLFGWNPRYCTSSVFRLMPNLKKLYICGVHQDYKCRSNDSVFQDLCYLDQLQELKFQIKKVCKEKQIVRRVGHPGRGILKRFPPLILPPPDAFPQNLKQLAFTGTSLRWKDLSIVSKLPNLEALKLSYDACKGKEWEVVGEGFPHLKFLILKQLEIQCWRASSDHFPCLQRLFVKSCWCLDSIPQDFSEITALELIDISSCTEPVGISAKQIQQDIEDNYGASVEVRIS